MKYLLSLMLLAMLALSFSAEAQGCDPRYYKPRTCEPYYVHPNPRLPNNPMHTVSPNPRDYTHGRMGLNSGYGYRGGCAYGACGGYVGNNNYGYVGGGHVHGGGCGHAGYPTQRRSIHWGISGGIRSGNGYGSGANLGFHVGSSQTQVR